MATVVAENIKKAWEMKDTLCAGIVARTCALRWRSQNLYLSYRQGGRGAMTSSCIMFWSNKFGLCSAKTEHNSAFFIQINVLIPS